MTARVEISRHILSERASRRAFLGVAALIFAASAAATILGCSSMSAMGDMTMSGGWTMSMAWMLMPGQSWPGVTAAFLGMWVVMMVAMMLPSFAPTLWRYREAVAGTGETRVGRLTAIVGIGYFSVWTAAGMVVFPLGLALAAAAMQRPALARTVPFVVGVVVLAAGAMQLTAWKVYQLMRCREAWMPRASVSGRAAAALRHGLRLGVHCILSCAGLIATLLALGVMDLRVMALVTAAITAERVTPAGVRVARGTGAVIIGLGLLLIARAAGVA